MTDQLALDFARAQGELGIAASQIRAEIVDPGFTERAAKFAYTLLCAHGPMTGEQIVDRCRALGFTPPDDRAFGAVIKWLLRRSMIERVGTGPRLKGHGTAGASVWRARA